MRFYRGSLGLHLVATADWANEDSTNRAAPLDAAGPTRRTTRCIAGRGGS